MGLPVINELRSSDIAKSVLIESLPENYYRSAMIEELAAEQIEKI